MQASAIAEGDIDSSSDSGEELSKPFSRKHHFIRSQRDRSLGHENQIKRRKSTDISLEWSRFSETNELAFTEKKQQICENTRKLFSRRSTKEFVCPSVKKNLTYDHDQCFIQESSDPADCVSELKSISFCKEWSNFEDTFCLSEPKRDILTSRNDQDEDNVIQEESDPIDCISKRNSHDHNNTWSKFEDTFCVPENTKNLVMPGNNLEVDIQESSDPIDCISNSLNDKGNDSLHMWSHFEDALCAPECTNTEDYEVLASNPEEDVRIINSDDGTAPSDQELFDISDTECQQDPEKHSRESTQIQNTVSSPSLSGQLGVRCSTDNSPSILCPHSSQQSKKPKTKNGFEHKFLTAKAKIESDMNFWRVYKSKPIYPRQVGENLNPIMVKINFMEAVYGSVHCQCSVVQEVVGKTLKDESDKRYLILPLMFCKKEKIQNNSVLKVHPPWRERAFKCVESKVIVAPSFIEVVKKF